MAVSATGQFEVLRGRHWSGPGSVSGLAAAFTRTVSCASDSSCTVLGLSGMSSRWQGGRWSTPTTVFPGGFQATVSLSCAAPDHCVAVTSKGLAATFG
jgi:hypothetical protein